MGQTYHYPPPNVSVKMHDSPLQAKTFKSLPKSVDGLSPEAKKTLSIGK